MRFVVVTGTDTDVGKTVATAALVCAAHARSLRASIVKPYQTGVVGDEPSDVNTVRQLSGCADVHELVRLDDALAPESAARRSNLMIPSVPQLLDEIVDRATGRDVTFVEGAGGVAVRLDSTGGTVATLAAALRERGHRVDVLVVTSIELGTLNHTELTVNALRAHQLEPSGLVLGRLPVELGLAERCNLDDLTRLTGVPIVARIPTGAGDYTSERFQASAPGWVGAG